MPRSRRLVAALSVAAMAGGGAFAASASAAVVTVHTACPVYQENYSDPAIQISGSGFTPNSYVILRTSSKAKPAPQSLGTASTNAAGAFATVTGAAFFNTFKTVDQKFNLIVYDGANPAVIALGAFRQVRLSYSRVPSSSRPAKTVKHIALGFPVGKTVWAHFRHHSKTRATKKLGTASAPCGKVTKRMRALPAKSRLGTWKVYVDQKQRFSLSSRPQVRASFTITQKFF